MTLTPLLPQALGRDRKEDHFNRAVVRRPEDEEEPLHHPLGGTPSNSTFDPFLPVSSLFPTDIPVDSPRTPSDNLPEKALSDLIIRFSLDFVLWQHCSIHPATCVPKFSILPTHDLTSVLRAQVLGRV